MIDHHGKEGRKMRHDDPLIAEYSSADGRIIRA
jgi:hypothetical protein